MIVISFCIHAYRNIVIKIQLPCLWKKLYWKARPTTTFSIAPSSVPIVEVNFMSQGLVVTFEQQNAPLTPVRQHIRVTSQWASIVSNHWQSDRLFNRLSRLRQKINPRCWLCEGNSPVTNGSPHKAETVLFWWFHQGNSMDQIAERRKISINVAVFPMFTVSMLCHKG